MHDNVSKQHGYAVDGKDDGTDVWAAIGAFGTSGQRSALAGSNCKFILDSMGRCRLSLFDYPGSVAFAVDEATGRKSDFAGVNFAMEGKTSTTSSNILRTLVCTMDITSRKLSCGVSDLDSSGTPDDRNILTSLAGHLTIASPRGALSLGTTDLVMEDVSTLPCPEGRWAIRSNANYAGLVWGSILGLSTAKIGLAATSSIVNAESFIFIRQPNGLCRMNAGSTSMIVGGTYTSANPDHNTRSDARDVWLVAPIDGTKKDITYCAFDPLGTPELFCRQSFNFRNTAVGSDSVLAIQAFNGRGVNTALTMERVP